MGVTIAYRRRASAFATALERGEHTSGPDLTPLLHTAHALGAADGPVPSAEFRAELRARLMAAPAAVADAPSHADRAGRRARRRTVKRRVRIGLAAFTAASLGLGAIAVAASADALPGDPLYGVKRVVESIELDLSGSGTSKGQEYLSLAGDRLGEVEAIAHQAGSRTTDPTAIGRMGSGLSDMRGDLNSGGSLLLTAARSHDPGAAKTIVDWATSHQQAWTALGQVLPPSLAGSYASISALINSLVAQAAPLSVTPSRPGSTTHADGLSQAQATSGYGGLIGGGADAGASGEPGGAAAVPRATPTGTASPHAGVGGTSSPKPGGTSTATPTPTGSPSGSATPTATTQPDLGIVVPTLLPGQPTVLVSLPPLLPGLPAITLGL